MPYIKNIVHKAYNYVLKTAFPSMTFPSRVSIMTCVNPEKHGIFNFSYIDRVNKMHLDFKLFHALHVEHPRILEILAMVNRRSFIIEAIPGYHNTHEGITRTK